MTGADRAMAGIPELNRAAEAAGAWLGDLQRRLDWEHADRTYLALLTTLHALRDTLPTDEAVRLGSSLPPLLRGLYFEGWHPGGGAREMNREAFFTCISDGVHRDPGIDPERVSRSVFSLLAERLPVAEIEEIRAASPASIHGLWPI
jgi:uncharacterized protein (DUF2267 family)